MIEFTWDSRKARRNEREHGISFPLARAALESQLGIPVEEQFREGEWRTNVVVPLRGIFLITVTVASYHGDEDEGIGTGGSEETEQAWGSGDIVIRIIMAREATTHEKAHYFESRPPVVG
jgi:uncharacterized DUF497 family protein